MNRSQLDRLRSRTTAFRDAIARDHAMMEESRKARQLRELAARELADELRRSEIPEGKGFEHGGLVVWFEGDSRIAGREALHHVFLAFYREFQG